MKITSNGGDYVTFMSIFAFWDIQHNNEKLEISAGYGNYI